MRIVVLNDQLLCRFAAKWPFFSHFAETGSLHESRMAIIGVAGDRTIMEQDYYAKRAKELGYPARSIFKLEEMQDRFHLIRKGALVLDIGAAPGSWSLFILKQLEGRVVGIDLKNVSVHHANFELIKGDIFDVSICDTLGEFADFDVVVSDAAPATTGIRLVDATRSGEIGTRVLEIATLLLKQRGNCVIKVFQSTEVKKILDRMKKTFRKAVAFKPKASRKASFETYLIGIGMIKAANR